MYQEHERTKNRYGKFTNLHGDSGNNPFTRTLEMSGYYNQILLPFIFQGYLDSLKTFPFLTNSLLLC